MHDQENQKNLLMAIVLSMAVLFAWQFFYAAPHEQERQARIRQEQAAKAKEQGVSGSQTASPQAGAPQRADQPQQPGAVPAPSVAGAPAVTRQGALDASPRVGIQTPSLIGSISLKGGRIDDLVLAKYRETVDPKSA